MVIGNGMIAKEFEDYNEDNRFVIFASGVSNSRTLNDASYDREAKLLKNVIAAHGEKTLVYFSTCSIYDPSDSASRYVLHKKHMEEIINDRQEHFHIFRCSNLVGTSTNLNTILNFFVYHIRNGINFDLWVNSTRNLLDVAHMYQFVNHILQRGLYQGKNINIANEINYPVTDIVHTIEMFLGIKANYTTVQKGSHFAIDVSDISGLARMLNIQFTKDYLQKLLNKYYSDK